MLLASIDSLSNALRGIGESPIVFILVLIGFMNFVTMGIESAFRFLGQVVEAYYDFLWHCRRAKERYRDLLHRSASSEPTLETRSRGSSPS